MRIGYFDRTFGALPLSNCRSAEATIKDTGANLGNLAFLGAAHHLFDDPIYKFDWATNPKDLSQSVDALLFPVANWLNSSVDLASLARMVREVNKPVILMGLGAQSGLDNAVPALKQGTRDFVLECAARSPSVFVRGPFTKEVCSTFGVHNTSTVGCPSILTAPGNDLGRRIEASWDHIGGKTAFHSLEIQTHLRETEKRLYQLAAKTQGSSFVVQHQVEIVDLILTGGRNLDEQQLHRLNWYCDFLSPGCDRSEMKSWLRNNTFFFDSVDAWQRFLRNFSRSVNTRIHGTILSLSAGIPAICLHHDSRTKELAETMAIPTMIHSDINQGIESVDDIFRRVRISGSHFDDRRQDLANKYIELFEQVGMTPSHHLKTIAAN